jgi:hypothetical protein
LIDMKSRGRRSAASLSLVSNQVEAIPRQRAPSELTKEQAGIWNAVVAAEPADWFSGSTRPLLAQYCRHIAAARHVAAMIASLDGAIAAQTAERSGDRIAIMLSAVKAFDRLQKMQERESRAIASLATKMRITQQATINQRGNRIESKKPWEV